MKDTTKVEDAVVQEETKSMTFRIDVDIHQGNGLQTCYMVVTGIPKDLPAEYEGTVQQAAEMQFAKSLEERKFIELYSEGKTAKDEKPSFHNINNIDVLTIKSVTKLDV